MHALLWTKDDFDGLEFTEVTLIGRTMAARGVALGSQPVAYRLDYRLETGPRFETASLEIAATGDGWRRTLDLQRSEDGEWSAAFAAEGEPPLPVGRAPFAEPGGDMSGLSGALDVDIEQSPLTNSMPVLREGLLELEGSVDLLMAFVSIPDLAVRPSWQRYISLRDLDDGGRLIRYESLDGSGFRSDLTFDRFGLVVDYPQLGHRIG